MLDYLAYLWARDITDETVGARRRLLTEVLDIEPRRSGAVDEGAGPNHPCVG